MVSKEMIREGWNMLGEDMRKKVLESMKKTDLVEIILALANQQDDQLGNIRATQLEVSRLVSRNKDLEKLNKIHKEDYDRQSAVRENRERVHEWVLRTVIQEMR